MKWIEETVKPEIENGSCKPRHVKVEKKKYNSDETYVVKKVAFYFPEHFKSVELEDWDDYNEKDYPYTENDEVKGIVWLRPGWYESIDCDNCDGYWSSPLKVIEWLDETTPEATTPLQEGKAATPVSAEEILKKHIGFQGRTNDKAYMQASLDHYRESGKPSGSFFEALKKAMEEYRNQAASTQGRVVAPIDFLEYCTDERNTICEYINSLEWNTELRTKVESLLICFDQMKDRLTPSTPAREVAEEEIENAAKEFAADYGYYPNQIITAFKEGAKFIAGYKAHKGKQ